MNAGISGTMVDHATEQQQSDSSSGNQNEYEHDNHYGKARTSIVSPTFHPYSRS